MSDTGSMPSRDVQWMIGIVLTAVIALSAQLAVQISGVRTDIRRLDDRLRAVEVAVAKVDQRLSTLERLHLPTPNPAD